MGKAMKKIAIISSILAIIISIYLVINSTKYHKKIRDNNNQSIEATTEFKTVEFNGITITLPSDYEFILDNGNNNLCTISSSKKKAYAYIEIIKDASDDLYQKDKLYNSVKNNGYNVSKPENTKISNQTIITMKYYKDNYKAILAYIKSADDDIFEVTVYSEENTFDYDYLNEIFYILKDAK